MQPFPALKDLPPFEGDAVAQIWLDPYGVRFLFESQIDLYAEFRVEHVDADGTQWVYECQASDRAPVVLHRLLYKRIVSIQREELKLTLVVEDGASLSVVSDLGQYESGHIRTPEGSFTVF